MTRDEAIAIVKAVYDRAPVERLTNDDLAVAEIDTLTELGVIKLETPPAFEHWLKPGAFVPVNENTVILLIQEVIRLRSISSPDGTK